MAYNFVLTRDWGSLVESINYGKEENTLYKLAEHNSKLLQKIITYFYATAILVLRK